MAATIGSRMMSLCVDCHMPKLTSNTLFANDKGRQERPQVRTHWIKVYPEVQSP